LYYTMSTKPTAKVVAVSVSATKDKSCYYCAGKGVGVGAYVYGRDRTDCQVWFVCAECLPGHPGSGGWEWVPVLPSDICLTSGLVL
jgi:hypothetical protein